MKKLVETLGAIAQKFADIKDIDELALSVEREVEQIVNVEYSGFYLYDPVADTIRLIRAKGFTEQERREAELTAMDRHPGWVIRNKSVLDIPDTASDPRSKDSERSFSVGSRLYYPIVHDDICVGAVGLARREKNAFTDEYKTLLAFICNIAGIALQNMFYAQRIRELAESKFKKLVEATDALIIFLDNDARITSVNPALVKVFGAAEEAHLGKELRELFAAASGDVVERALKVPPGKEGAQNVDVLVEAPGGAMLHFEMSIIPLTEDSERVGGVVILRDVTERKAAEMALKASEERYRRQFDEALDAIVVADAETGIIKDCNRAATELVGRSKEELVGQHQKILHPSWEIEEGQSRSFRLHATERAGEPVEAVIVTRDGGLRSVSIKANVFESEGRRVLQGIFRDTTKQKHDEKTRKELEAEVQQAQKLGALGQLAGGIAHDFNNLLTGVLGNASQALVELDDASPVRELIEQIEIAATRAGELAKQMLAYSGRGRFVVEPLDLSSVVREMTQLIEASISKKATVLWELDDGLPTVRADAAQLQQIVMSLVTNAAEAMEGHEGVITVRTSVTTASTDPDASALGQGSSNREYVVLEVVDSGCGMSDDVRERIFEPFFSTKFTGRGLGLSAVQGIVRGHEGAIVVKTREGAGTRVRVLLPAVETQTTTSVPAPPTDAPSSPGKVLVVDDEEVVLRMARRSLEHGGYHVIVARDGKEAIKTFKEAPHSVSLVVLDLTMPKMGGAETFKALRRIKPDVQVILSSGYDEHEVMELFSDGLAGFLQKPYTHRGLIEKVRDVLGY